MNTATLKKLKSALEKKSYTLGYEIGYVCKDGWNIPLKYMKDLTLDISIVQKLHPYRPYLSLDPSNTTS